MITTDYIIISISASIVQMAPYGKMLLARRPGEPGVSRPPPARLREQAMHGDLLSRFPI